jgi:hypothetical protein
LERLFRAQFRCQNPPGHETRESRRRVFAPDGDIIAEEIFVTSLFSSSWTLRAHINGEWEECRYDSPAEALEAIKCLTADYGVRRAVLFGPEKRTPRTAYAGPKRSYIN